MLTCSRLPPLPENDHGTSNRPVILPAPLPVVRSSPPADLGPRPTLHLSLRTSPRQRAGNLMEPVNGVSPPDRRPVGAEKSVGRAVPQALIHQSARLGRDASPGHPRSQ